MKRTDFEQRFGVSYSTFMRLAYPDGDAPRFIFPVLNHPRHYLPLDIRVELDGLLSKMPPTWERWHAALEFTGGNVWFERSDRQFDYAAMWSVPELRATWRKRLRTTSEAFISKEIKQQIRNNYTDLCLVGRESKANEIAEASYTDPEYAINDLFYSSDLYAYPQVMGAGGTANIRATQAPPKIRDRPIIAIKKLLPSAEYFDSEVIDSLFRGLRFDYIPREFRFEFLLKWHRSGNAERAREAYQSLLECAKLQSPSLDKLHKTMKAIISELQEFCRNAEPTTEESFQKAHAKQNVASAISVGGGIACTILGLFLYEYFLATLGIGFTFIGLEKWTTRERVIEKLLKKNAPKVPIELYRHYAEMRGFSEEFLRRVQRSSIEDVDIIDASATSIPVRTIWWTD
ncbi:MAG: hypothetical protein E3J72_00950 [Planctomycetota bacterium]|nr:MAG: hypothetical protein E3J72_00950 [Planctomycetota bacterium]